MKEYCNEGTVMQLESTNCTIINKGTIMHVDGCNNLIENYGTIMGGNGNVQPQVKQKIVYRERVVYRDRPTDESKSDVVNKLKLQIQQLVRHIKESENAKYLHRLENMVNFYENRCAQLNNELKCLKEELENTSRLRLLEQIEELKETLKRSENRERVSRNQQYDKGYQAGVVDGSNKKKEVFDWGVKPSKEEAAALLSQLKIWLDCEDYGETPSP